MNRDEEIELINKVFTAKSKEILAKLDHEIITTQDMLSLYLKEFFQNRKISEF